VPIALGIAISFGVDKKLLLLSLAFSSSLGGMLTLVGTPPHGIVNDVLEMGGFRPFGFFEFTKISIFMLPIGIVYMLFLFPKFFPVKTVSRKAEEEVVTYDRRTYYSAIIFFTIAFMMMFNLLPLSIASMLGICLVIISKCLSVEDAFRAINWSVIFLFAGMLSLSVAMEKSGAASLIVNALTKNVQAKPYYLFVAIISITMVLTQIMSNTAVSGLMASLALSVAEQIGTSPYPFLMGVAIASSSCFLTPIATPPNMIILSVGDFKFKDFLRVGWPLQLLTFVISLLIIPWVWPF
jgi:anion transporter